MPGSPADKPPRKTRAAPLEPLAVYRAVIAAANTHKLDALLSFDRGVWELEVCDGKKVIASGRSTAEAPVCFTHIAAQVRRSFDVGELLSE